MWSVLAGVALLIFAMCLTWLRLQMRGRQLVRREIRGLLHIELWRCTELHSHADGLGGHSFPTPIESRSRAWVFCEVPLWVRCESIGLPCGAEARFDQLDAADYDHHFTAAFKASATGHRASRTHVPA